MDFYSDIHRDIEFRKKYGAHFTPEKIVVEMCTTILELIDVADVKKFKFLDIASGTGIFSFYFAKLFAKKFNVDFKEVIKNNCCMAEFDPVFISKCRSIYKRLGCEINIVEGDALFTDRLVYNTYDVVLGNPPYIRIQNLEKEYRKKIQGVYGSCVKGASDIYLAFIERSLNLVKSAGCVALITPSSYLRSEAGKYIREGLTPYLYKIKDFGSQKIFDCGTYTAITYTNGFQSERDFIYEFDNGIVEYDRCFFKDKLLINRCGNTLLKNVCDIKGGIATLRDKIFIIKPDTTDATYLYVNSHKIERASVKKFVKLSEVKTSEDIDKSPYFCIYPYKDVLDGYTRYNEDEFKKSFPETFKYLKCHKEELLTRDKGKNNGYSWFEFGRTQGLNNVKECVVTSTMNYSPNFLKTNLNGFLFGSGLALYNSTINSEKFLDVLNSEAMREYIYFNGAKYAGNWRGYNKKILERFKFYLTNQI